MLVSYRKKCFLHVRIWFVLGLGLSLVSCTRDWDYRAYVYATMTKIDKMLTVVFFYMKIILLINTLLQVDFVHGARKCISLYNVCLIHISLQIKINSLSRN